MNPSPRIARRLIVLGLATVTTVATFGVAHAEGTSAGRHGRLIDRPQHGRAALAALGTRLDQAARLNRMSASGLRSVLDRDTSAWLGRDGRLFYIEEAPTAAEATTAQATTAQASVAPIYPVSQTFALHSLPGSNHTIYLDFDGFTLRAGGFWDVQGNMTPGAFEGFSMDGSPAFSDTERAVVQKVWQIVAEKYAPFDVDVTTQDPGAAAYNRDGSGDPTYGDHVVFSDDPDAVNQACGGSCSGIAILGGFDYTGDNTDSYEPAWVFTSKTHDLPALIAHTAAHEIGHTFGLHHDGISGGATYYAGQGNWFPLMGSSLNAVGQFSKGEYSRASNTEDDLAVIAANGAPFRADDFGSSIAAATDLGTRSSYGVRGVISSDRDADVFAVRRGCTTGLTAAAYGIGEGQAVDLQVSVYDAAGALVANADPASGQDYNQPHKPTGLNATATAKSLPAGAAYVRVAGVGHGSPATTGYSGYGSVGGYRLSISGCEGDGGASLSATSTSVTRPSAPRTRRASAGARGGAVTAIARWAAPASNGGAAIRGYRVRAFRVDSHGRVVRGYTSALRPASARSLVWRLPKGRYRFRVLAINRVGSSRLSTYSAIVTAR
ncbi:MAG: hypothetical protein J7518_20805 [Nocardioidaceae bacterium]|nr:hypothetical protein [Nocardioidaceae bacterium]